MAELSVRTTNAVSQKVNIEKYCFVMDRFSEQFYFIFNTFATQGMQYLPN